jgi:hypothetical protein
MDQVNAYNDGMKKCFPDLGRPAKGYFFKEIQAG